ncbi:HEAT repeat domain-containing protein [Catellatospora sp. NPDC049133]|uniref:HEAT repeat domain-containing protein n=1 Tax=Catellatospora sp. NPDC049133 TaxID=3155499 RepID=UPI0033D687FB
MGNQDRRVEPAWMPDAELFAAAATEVSEGDPLDPAPHLVALHERPTRAVYATAVRLLDDEDPDARELGVRVLRELGRQDDAGRRPFSTQAIPLLVGRLDREQDPYVLQNVISALGYNAAWEALDEVLRFTGHPNRWVRFHVAAVLPALVDPERIEPKALEALRSLCRDEEADTRYYALYAMVEEISGADPELVARSLADLVDDPDEQIRELARVHLAAGDGGGSAPD